MRCSAALERERSAVDDGIDFGPGNRGIECAEQKQPGKKNRRYAPARQFVVQPLLAERNGAQPEQCIEPEPDPRQTAKTADRAASSTAAPLGRDSRHRRRLRNTPSGPAFLKDKSHRRPPSPPETAAEAPIMGVHRTEDLLTRCASAPRCRHNEHEKTVAPGAEASRQRGAERNEPSEIKAEMHQVGVDESVAEKKSRYRRRSRREMSR